MVTARNPFSIVGLLFIFALSGVNGGARGSQLEPKEDAASTALAEEAKENAEMAVVVDEAKVNAGSAATADAGKESAESATVADDAEASSESGAVAGDEKADAKQVSAESAVAAGDIAALTTRATARWEAILRRDYQAAYRFTTPAYRTVHDYTQFTMNYAEQVIRKNAKVIRVELDDAEPDTATVVIKIDFVTSALGRPMESAGFARETWVKREGIWWFVQT